MSFIKDPSGETILVTIRIKKHELAECLRRMPQHGTVHDSLRTRNRRRRWTPRRCATGRPSPTSAVSWALGAVPGSHRVGFRAPPSEPGVLLSLSTGLSIDGIANVGWKGRTRTRDISNGRTSPSRDEAVSRRNDLSICTVASDDRCPMNAKSQSRDSSHTSRTQAAHLQPAAPPFAPRTGVLHVQRKKDAPNQFGDRLLQEEKEGNAR